MMSTLMDGFRRLAEDPPAPPPPIGCLRHLLQAGGSPALIDAHCQLVEVVAALQAQVAELQAAAIARQKEVA